MEAVSQALDRLVEERDRLQAAYQAAADRGNAALALALRCEWLRIERTILELRRDTTLT